MLKNKAGQESLSSKVYMWRSLEIRSLEIRSL